MGNRGIGLGHSLPNIPRGEVSFADLSTYRAEIYGFSAIWIVLLHAVGCGIDWSFELTFLVPLQVFIKTGSLGVDIFLVLSGMSLYYSWQNNQEIDRFFKRRVLRLLPSFFLIAGTYVLFNVYAA